VDPELVALAEQQHGLLSVAQVVDAGHRHLLRRRLAPGPDGSAVRRRPLADDLLSLVEHTVRSRRLDIPHLREVRGRGASGSVALRNVLDELSADGLDRWVRRLVRLLVDAGLPRPRLEVPMLHRGRVRAYLDGYWEEACLAVEADDWETHADRSAQERDRRLLTAYARPAAQSINAAVARRVSEERLQ
jgi:hypothetical protein